MGRFYSIIKPETAAVTNLVTNPSIEVDTTGYTAVGGSIARSTAQRRRGIASLAVTPTAGTTDGVYYGTISLTNGVTYTLAADVKGAAGVVYTLTFRTTGGAIKGTETQFTGTGAWQRVTTSWTADSSTTFRLYVVKYSSASTAVFYVDGLQVVAAAYDVTYIDGDQADCYWNGVAHASTSYRKALSRAGGREYYLDDLSVYVKTYPGIGMPPNKHHTQERGLLPGAEFLGRKVLPRTVVLTCDTPGSSHANMHALRQALIDIIKPDAGLADEPFLLRYYGADSTNPLQLWCVYDSGLEFNGLEGFTDEAPIRFIAYDPLWYEDGNDAQVLTSSTTFTAAYAAAKVDGAWGALSSLFNGAVYAIAADLVSNRIYFGGAFTTAGGVTVNRVCYWDGSAFQAMTNGAAGGDVRALAVDAAGNVWVGGAFTTVNSITADGLARWNRAAGTWTQFANGTAGDVVYAIAIAQNGDVYIGGNFLNWDANANEDYIIKYNGSAFSALGTGANGIVYTIAIAPNGSVFIGGAFTTANGVTVYRIAYWNGTTFVAIGAGGGMDLDGTVYAIEILPDGRVYVGGAFSTPYPYLILWNGTNYVDLDSGMDGNVYSLEYGSDGLLYAGGAFTSAGGKGSRQMVVYNGTSWAPLDTSFTGTVYALVHYRNNLYVGINATSTATVGEDTTVTNGGSLTVYPVCKIARSGGTSASVEYLRNETTDVTIWLDYDLLDGETLTLDFRPGKRSIKSSYFGEVPRAVLRNSEFASFNLRPGTNKVSTFVYPSGSPTITATLEWQPAHWSADGA